MEHPKKFSGSQQETEAEAERRVLKPFERGSEVRRSRRKAGRKARR